MDDSLTLSLFFESWELFSDAVYAGVIAGVVLGFLGVYLVGRRMVFMSASLSQVSSLGVALSYLAKGTAIGFLASGWGPQAGAAAVTLASLAVLTSRRLGHHRDSFLGLAFMAGSAGTLLVGTRIVEEMVDINTLLFGSAVAVLPEELTLLGAVGVVTLLLHLWFYRGFEAISFDPDGAKIRGLPVKMLEWTLLVTVAVMIAVSTRTIGALPSFAFSVLPAWAAARLAKTLGQTLILAGILGGLAAFVGYLAAFLYEFPVGATQTVVAALMAIGLGALSYAFGPRVARGG